MKKGYHSYSEKQGGMRMRLEKMIELCDSFTPIEMEIAHYVLEHKDDMEELSIQELSDKVFVSKSGIHRFCKKLGLKGFNELKVRIAKDSADLQTNDSLINVNYPFEQNDGPKEIAFKIQELYKVSIQDTFAFLNQEDLKKVSQLLYEAEVIDIYTQSHNLYVAKNFQDDMLTIGRAVNCPKTTYKHRLTVLASTPKHVAILMSYSGRASFILPIIKMLYEKSIPIVFISKAGNNFYSQYITYSLKLSDKENNRQRISQFSSHIAMQYMMDILFSCIYNLNREENIKYLQEYIDYMDDRDLND